MQGQDMTAVREAEARALVIAEQVATLLSELDSIHPGSVSIGAGRVRGLGVEIRSTGTGQWAAETSR